MKEKSRELLFTLTKKDFKLNFFSGTGAGGQHRNRHMNCVRLQHPDSGAMTTGQSHREQRANIKEAFKNLVKHPKFKIWHATKVNEVVSGKTLEQQVDEMMKPENLKFECKDENGRWVVVDETK